MKKATLITEMSPEDLNGVLEGIIRKVLQEIGISGDTKREAGLLSDDSIVEILGVSKATLYLWRRERKIPFQRIGKKIFYNLSEVKKAMSAMTSKESIRHRRPSRRKEGSDL
jgi:predicted DNA-binding transcriptional regulator AlpA